MVTIGNGTEAAITIRQQYYLTIYGTETVKNYFHELLSTPYALALGMKNR